MAFEIKDLSVLAYANGFTLWHYRTADAPAEVAAPQYFATACDLLRVGDMIFANTEDSTSGGLFRVAANADGAIDVADMTAIGSTNTAA